MSTRGDILELLQSEEVATEERIIEQLDAKPDTVIAALQGLSGEDAVNKFDLLGHETYYAIPDNVDIEQAAEGSSNEEIAEEIVRESSILGDPSEGTGGVDNIFENLY